MDVLHSKIEEGKEDYYGLLLIPCDVVGYGQFIDVVLTEYILEGKGDDCQ